MTHLVARTLPTRASALRCCLLAASLATILPTQVAWAAITRSGDEVIVEAHEVIDDDLIVWGSYIRIDGIVRGDLVALGTDVVVEGVIEGDLIAAGKTVYLNGAVHDDARIGAFATALGERSMIGDDCFVLAYSLETKPASRTGGTAWLSVAQALLSGQVAEAILARAGALELAGLVAGDVSAVVGGIERFDYSTLVIDLSIEVPDVAPGLRLSEGAHIGGNLDYRAEDEATIDLGARVAGETHREPWRRNAPQLPEGDEPESEPTRWRPAMDRFLLLALLSFGLLSAAPRFTHARADDITDDTLRAIGWGVGAFTLTGLASVVLGLVWLMSVAMFASNSGTLALGLTAAVFFLQAALISPFLVVLFYVAPAVACLAIGLALMARMGRPPVGDSIGAGSAPLLAGLAIYCVLRLVPVVGTLVAILAALAGLGALGQWLQAIRRDANEPA